jgi:YHS domain-containing protein
MTNWPTTTDYSQAIQAPNTCLLDNELRYGHPLSNSFGLPVAWSGGFAVVFQLRASRGTWAVRCFTKRAFDQEERYAALSAHLARKRRPTTFVDFTFIRKGILANGTWYPILKMPWVAGTRLDEYVEQLVRSGNTGQLANLAERFRTLVVELERHGIEHGDLQHGNILVSSDIKLVDYDGVFISGLQGRKSLEVGHRHYQHPQRTNTFYGEGLDRFSALSIYLSLTALSSDPTLWKQYHQDECLILSQYDYAAPTSSRVLRALLQSSSSKVRALTSLLIDACGNSPTQLSRLEDFIQKAGRIHPRPPAELLGQRDAPVPKYTYPRRTPSRQLPGPRQSIHVTPGICAAPQCIRSLKQLSHSYYLDNLDQLAGKKVRFCSKACLQQFIDQRMCAQCSQLLASKYWYDEDVNRMMGTEKRFCTQACLFEFRDQLLCTKCGHKLPKQYWHNPEIDQCYGYERRFCSSRCLEAFHAQHLCAHCDGALLDKVWHNDTIDGAFGEHLRFCSDDCATTFREQRLCEECRARLPEKYWSSGTVNSTYGREVRFCSQTCVIQHHRKYLCLQCDTKLEENAWGYKQLDRIMGFQARFCSEECAVTYWRERICLQCGEKLPVAPGEQPRYFYKEDVDKRLGYRGRFCSRECAAAYHARLS